MFLGILKVLLTLGPLFTVKRSIGYLLPVLSNYLSYFSLAHLSVMTFTRTCVPTSSLYCISWIFDPLLHTWHAKMNRLGNDSHGDANSLFPYFLTQLVTNFHTVVQDAF